MDLLLPRPGNASGGIPAILVPLASEPAKFGRLFRVLKRVFGGIPVRYFRFRVFLGTWLFCRLLERHFCSASTTV